MLEKRDVIYYRRLAYTQGGLGIAMLCACFISGVSAKFHMTEINAFVPYWVGIPLVMQGMATMAAAKTGKRWPLAIWVPLFIITLTGICAYLIVMPPYKMDIYEKYPCYTQHNYKTDKMRCVCAYSEDNYLKVNGADNTAPCIRALDIMLIMGNVNYMFSILALVPELLMFVLVCNDLCCLSCRRAALVPQVIVTTGGANQPAQYLPVQSEVVTFRTDDQPGSSSGQQQSNQAGQQQSNQAGPLPEKPQNPENVPHSF